jgi:8-oxo-dGTP pyrophosphatase MutT (NUDIX family)
MSDKALVIPYRGGQVLIQDRSNIKKIPYLPWGYFGGGIEEGEAPIEAAIREIKEELDLTILSEDLVALGKFYNPQDQNPNVRHVF